MSNQNAQSGTCIKVAAPRILGAKPPNQGRQRGTWLPDSAVGCFLFPQRMSRWHINIGSSIDA